MASSLLFRLQSIFDSKGIQDAKSGFTSVLSTFGLLTVALGKQVISWKNLGAAAGIVTLMQIPRLIKYLHNAVPAAAAAELSFVRLKNGLDRIGKGSQENIKAVRDFAEQSARSIGVSVEATQEAVAMALRRTGNITSALKEVAAAQNFAAATGMDLVRATQILNLAQAGNSRVLRQYTNLRQQDIESARRQGTLIDLVAKKFEGAAKAQASTLIALQERLKVTRQQTQEEIGGMSLAFEKLKTVIALTFSTAILNTIRFEKQMLFSTEALKGAFAGSTTFLDRFLGAMVAGRKPAEAFALAIKQAAIAIGALPSTTGKEFFFDQDKALELANLRLHKSLEERRQLNKDVARADALLAIAEQGNAEALNKEQIAFIEQFAYGRKRLEDILVKSVTDQRTAAQKQSEAREKLLQAGPGKGLGLSQQIKDMSDLAVASARSGDGVAKIAENLRKIGNLPELVAKAFALVSSSVAASGKQLDDMRDKVFLLNSEMNTKTFAGKFDKFTQNLKSIVETQIKPNFEVKLNLITPVEAIRAAVQAEVQKMAPVVINQLISAAQKQQRTNIANSPGK